MKLQEVVAYNLKTQHILTEGWDTLSESQRIFMGKAERELWPLMEQLTKVFEAELTSDQIQSIFKGAETHAMDSGQNKTAMGKAGDALKVPGKVMKAVNDKINELGKLAQKTGPVQHLDKKFEELKKQIGSSDGKIVQGVKAVSDWAKENPGKASLAVAILTAAAAFASGPGGGAAVGFLLRSSKDLLQGEKLSTAAGKAVKTAAIGALAGMAFDAIGDAVVDNIEADGYDAINSTAESLKNAAVTDAVADVSAEYSDVLPQLSDGFSNKIISGNINAYNYNFNVILTGDQQGTYEALSNAVHQAANQSGSFSPEALKSTAELHDFLASVQASPDQSTMRAAIAALEHAKATDITHEQLVELGLETDNLEAFVDSATEKIPGAAAVIQGATQQANDFNKEAVKAGQPKKGENYELPLEKPAEAYKRDLHNRLAEVGPDNAWMDDPKYADPSQQKGAQMDLGLDDPNTLGAKAKRGLGAAGKWAKGVAGKAVAGTKQGMKDVGNKVTANKLNKDWQKAGEPTDAGSIVNILSSAGLSNDDITAIGTGASVELPVSAEPEADAGAETGSDPEGVKPNQGTDNKIENGTKAEYDGKEYTQSGGEWVSGGKKATPEIEKELDKQVATPEDGEAVPSDGGGDAIDQVPADGTNVPGRDYDADDEAEAEQGTDAELGPEAEPTAERNPKIKVAPGAGQMAKGNDGDDYIWGGGQWINNTTNKVAKKEVAAELGTPGAEPEAGTEPEPGTDTTGAEPEAGTDTTGAEPEAGTDNTGAGPEAGTDNTGADTTASADPTKGSRTFSTLDKDSTDTTAGTGAETPTDTTVSDLANAITTAGVGDVVKAELETGVSGGGGTEPTLAQIRAGTLDAEFIPNLAKEIKKAGVGEVVKQELTSEQTADMMT